MEKLTRKKIKNGSRDEVIICTVLSRKLFINVSSQNLDQGTGGAAQVVECLPASTRS
jgi:hypothetical protein